MFRRRRLPDELVGPHDAFEALIPPLERAKAALTSSVPGTRLPGRPLAETLLEFEQELADVRDRMPAWRSDLVEGAWVAADAGLREALARAERLRFGASDPAGFEGLIGMIGDLLAPLDAFHEAAERFRDLRR
jgi:hypothetical protein